MGNWCSNWLLDRGEIWPWRRGHYEKSALLLSFSLSTLNMRIGGQDVLLLRFALVYISLSIQMIMAHLSAWILKQIIWREGKERAKVGWWRVLDRTWELWLYECFIHAFTFHLWTTWLALLAILWSKASWRELERVNKSEREGLVCLEWGLHWAR